MATDRYIDLAYAQDGDGIFDLVIDAEAADFAKTAGLESALLVSLFSDRRADESEVRDPFQRRGWIGDLVSDIPNDRYGSGLWLYEQRRMTAEIAVGVRLEAEQSLDWMRDDGLIEYAEGMVMHVPSARRLDLVVTLHFIDGGVSQRAYTLADATRTGMIARL